MKSHKAKVALWKNILWIAACMVLVTGIGICGSYLIVREYYTIYYIDGKSMYPTFNSTGGPIIEDQRYDFGSFDAHQDAISKVKRFDIVTTYYDSDFLSDGSLSPSATRKIKRLIGFPGETVKFDDGVLKIKYAGSEEFVTPDLPDNMAPYANPDCHLNGEKTLGEDQYYVKGDNWYCTFNGGSYKCSSYDTFNNTPVKYSYLIGKLVMISGTCKADKSTGKVSDLRYSWPRFY